MRSVTLSDEAEVRPYSRKSIGFRVKYLSLLILMFGFSDILASIKIGAISASAAEWAAIGICSAVLSLYHGVSKSLIVRLKWFLLFTLFYSVNALRATSLMYAIIDVAYAFIPVVLSLLTYGAVKSGLDIYRLVYVILISAFIAPIIYLISYVTGSIEYVEGLGLLSVIGMRSASLVSLMISAYALGVIFAFPNDVLGTLRKLAYIALTVSVGMIIITQSRTATLALFVFIAIVSVAYFSLKSVTLSVSILGVVLVAVLTYKPLTNRLLPPEDLSIAEAMQRGDYTSGRALIWSVTFDKYLESPWIGHGTGNAKVFVEDTFPTSAGLPHNEYLRLLFDGGPVGVILMVIALLGLVSRSFLLWRSSAAQGVSVTAALHLGTFLASVGAMVSAIFDNVFLYIFVMSYLFIGVGMSEKAVRLGMGRIYRDIPIKVERTNDSKERC